MRIIVVGLRKSELTKYIKEHYPSFKIVRKNPDMVVCYGGDGTLLFGEAEYPGIPKVMIRHSRVCRLCSDKTRDTILELLEKGEYQVIPHMKLEVEAQGRVLQAVNDVVIGHKAVNGTLRAKVFVNGQQYGNELFGDGVVVSTPLGSTGYYQSITRSNFQEGIGIAFNNSVNTVSHLVVDEGHSLEIEVTRGPGLVAADNIVDEIPIDTGDRAAIRVADEQAQIVRFDEEYHQYNVNTGSDRVQLGYCQVCRKPYANGVEEEE